MPSIFSYTVYIERSGPLYFSIIIKISKHKLEGRDGNKTQWSGAIWQAHNQEAYQFGGAGKHNHKW